MAASKSMIGLELTAPTVLRESDPAFREIGQQVTALTRANLWFPEVCGRTGELQLAKDGDFAVTGNAFEVTDPLRGIGHFTEQPGVDRDSAVLVYILDREEVVAVALGRRRSGLAAYTEHTIAEVTRRGAMLGDPFFMRCVSVQRDYRGRDLGVLCMRRLIEEAGLLGHSAVLAHCWQKNLSAFTAYGQAGFHRIPELSQAFDVPLTPMHLEELGWADQTDRFSANYDAFIAPTPGFELPVVSAETIELVQQH